MARSRIVRYIRDFLHAKDFIEVETPIMSAQAGGAAARPFITHHNELKKDMFLRVAPELYLKELIVGGLDRVFEVGKQFRNEGIDLTHNPEFTSVEFYQAYADCYDLMKTVEELISGLAVSVTGSTNVTYTEPSHTEEETKSKADNEQTAAKKSTEINFATPFKRIDILPELSRHLGMEITGESLLDADAAVARLLTAAAAKNILIDEPHTLARVLDKLVGEFIEPQCTDPTFITGFPEAMSPLAKSDRKLAGLTERFELFINCKEVCNAYTELNQPHVQRERFRAQAAAAAAGDDEAMPVDEEFCVALDYALPPTAGCGIGIDRLVMYLTDAPNIRDVILFPVLKPKNN